MLSVFACIKKNIGLALLFSGLICAQTSSYAISNKYMTTYSNFLLPSSALNNIDMPLAINIDPGTSAYRFFSEQLAIGNFTTYLGLQTDMTYPNNKGSGKGAIFSIWDASGATPGSLGSWCQSFGNEGTGYSCRMPYNWTAGNTYRLRISQISNNSWTAYIKNMTTGIEVQLGIITLPTTKNPLLLGGITTFTEYYGGDFPTCCDLKLSQVTWGMPTGNNDLFKSAWISNSIGPGDCSTLRLSTGTGPTIHSMGA
jgi:hypothetical protein